MVLEQEDEEYLAERTLERTRASGGIVHGAGHKPQLEKPQQQMLLEKSMEARWSEET